MVARRILVPPVRVRILPRQLLKLAKHFDLKSLASFLFQKCQPCFWGQRTCAVVVDVKYFVRASGDDFQFLQSVEVSRRNP